MKTMENKENQCLFQYDTLKINVNELKSSTELKEYLTEWGADYSALDDFCEEYQEKHGNKTYIYFYFVCNTFYKSNTRI